MIKNQNLDYFQWIINVINLIIVVSLFITVFHVLSVIFIPNANEYDDPSTNIQETFPWNPPLFKDPDKVLKLYLNSLLRHISLLNQHVSTVVLLTWVGRIFFLVFISNIKNTIQKKEKFGIHNYVEFGIGSIVGSIIYLTGTSYIREQPSAAYAIFFLSISCIVLYSIHPHIGGLFQAIKKRIEKGI
jgi:hypothetical protein